MGSPISTIATYGAKTVGAIALFGTLRGVVDNTKQAATQKTKEEEATELTDMFVRNLSEQKSNPVKTGFAKKYEEFKLDNEIVPTLKLIKNHVVEFAKNLLGSAIPIGLAVGAILTKTDLKIPVIKGFGPKVLGWACAAGVLLSGVKTMASIMGIGKIETKV